MKFLDPLAIAKLRGLDLPLMRRAAAPAPGGRHRGRLRGFSRDFSEHRPYVPGDEPRALDWKVFARQDRFYVREYTQESLMRVLVAVDASGSMAFGDAPSKWELACRLAMALAYLVVRPGDAVGLVTFSDRLLEFIPPRSKLSQLEVMDAALWRGVPAGASDLPAALRAVGDRAPRRSALIVVSDLAGPAQEVAGVLRALRARGHDMMALQTLDAAERDLGPAAGAVVFEDLEDGSLLATDADSIRWAYRQEFERRRRLYETTCHRCEIPYAAAMTDVPWDLALKRFLAPTP